jgi:hypothetical protein
MPRCLSLTVIAFIVALATAAASLPASADSKCAHGRFCAHSIGHPKHIFVSFRPGKAPRLLPAYEICEACDLPPGYHLAPDECILHCISYDGMSYGCPPVVCYAQ